MRSRLWFSLVYAAATFECRAGFHLCLVLGDTSAASRVDDGPGRWIGVGVVRLGADGGEREEHIYYSTTTSHSPSSGCGCGRGGGTRGVRRC